MNEQSQLTLPGVMTRSSFLKSKLPSFPFTILILSPDLVVISGAKEVKHAKGEA
jgi:hypothetical protein